MTSPTPMSAGSTGFEITSVPGGSVGRIDEVRITNGVAPVMRGTATPTVRRTATPSTNVPHRSWTNQRAARACRDPEAALGVSRESTLRVTVMGNLDQGQFGFAARVSWVSETVRALRVTVRFWVSLAFTVV